MEGAKEKPIGKFKDGGFEVAIWKNNVNGIESFSARLSKSYKKNEEWHTESISVFEKDLARCIFLLGEGYRFILSRNPKVADINGSNS